MGFGFAVVTPSASSVAQVSAGAVWSYPQRSLTDIQSLVTAIQLNNPNLLSSLSDILYVPAPYFVGQVSATQVAAFIDNAIRNYGLAGAFASFISNYPYGLWSTNFVSNIVTNPYLTATSVGMLVTNQGMSANNVQLILYNLAKNYDYNKWIYTVTYNTPSITFSANATLSTNVLIAQNITVASGVTVTCGTQTCFFVAQSFNNYGTIVSPLGATGAVSPASGYIGNGGTGGGGVVIIAVTAVLGTVNVAGSPGGNGSASPGSEPGNGGAGGVFYIVSGMAVPEGGKGGGASGGGGGYNGGGGGASGYAGGAGGGSTTNSFSSPNAMMTYILQGLSDWWLINIKGNTPSSTTPLVFMYGSGGGSGGGWGANGSGGGGGGEAIVYGYDIVSGNIIAVGGTGGSGSYGGGGGGGGLVLVLYGATSGNVTVNVAGGPGMNGGATGASGTAYIAAVTVNG